MVGVGLDGMGVDVGERASGLAGERREAGKMWGVACCRIGGELLVHSGAAIPH